MFRLVSFNNGLSYLTKGDKFVLPESLFFTRNLDVTSECKVITWKGYGEVVVDGATYSSANFRYADADKVVQVGSVNNSGKLIVTANKACLLEDGMPGLQIMCSADADMGLVEKIFNAEELGFSLTTRLMQLKPTEVALLGDAIVEVFEKFPIDCEHAIFKNGKLTHISLNGSYTPLVAYLNTRSDYSQFDFKGMLNCECVLNYEKNVDQYLTNIASFRNGDCNFNLIPSYSLLEADDLVVSSKCRYLVTSEHPTQYLFTNVSDIVNLRVIGVKVDEELSKNLQLISTKLNKAWADSAAKVEAAIQTYFNEIKTSWLDIVNTALGTKQTYGDANEFCKAYARRGLVTELPSLVCKYETLAETKELLQFDARGYAKKISVKSDSKLNTGLSNFVKKVANIPQTESDKYTRYSCKNANTYGYDWEGPWYDRSPVYSKTYEWFRQPYSPKLSVSYGFSEQPYVRIKVTDFGCEEMRGTHPSCTIKGERYDSELDSGSALKVAKLAWTELAESMAKSIVDCFKKEVGDYYHSDKVFLTVKQGKGNVGAYRKDWTYGGHGDCEIKIDAEVVVYLNNPKNETITSSSKTDEWIRYMNSALNTDDYVLWAKNEFSTSVSNTLRADADFMDALYSVAKYVRSSDLDSTLQRYVLNQSSGLLVNAKQVNLLPYSLEDTEHFNVPDMLDLELTIVVDGVSYTLCDIIGSLFDNFESVADPKIKDLSTCLTESLKVSDTLVGSNFVNWRLY